MSHNKEDQLRTLPSVELLLQHTVLVDAQANHPRSVVVQSAREVLEDVRQEILAGGAHSPEFSVGADDLAAEVLARVHQKARPSYTRVINATGVVIHTNLGRSVLSKHAMAAIQAAAAGYSNLEYDLAAGVRTTRQIHVELLLREITGAEAALVVNNNAGAVMLLAHTLAPGRECVVSRGQLVEIGGSFRLPEVLTASGAELVEVGTTNRTTAGDYEAAISPNTGMLLRVHRSNFVMAGFVADVELRDLVQIGKKHNVPVIDDLGSGALLETAELGLPHEPTPQEAVAAGADAVCFSGDKLLGGTQAGIIVGRRDVVDKARGAPMARALRIDKLNLAGLEATLLEYRDAAKAVSVIPTLGMIAKPVSVIEKSAETIASSLKDLASRVAVGVEAGESEIGGGASPTVTLPTVLLTLSPKGMTARALAERLRKAEPPVVTRIREDRVLIDPRTLLDGEDELVGRAVREVVSGAEPENGETA